MTEPREIPPRILAAYRAQFPTESDPVHMHAFDAGWVAGTLNALRLAREEGPEDLFKGSITETCDNWLLSELPEGE